MIPIILRAMSIVFVGSVIMLVAGLWGETEIGFLDVHLFRAGILGTLSILLSQVYLLRKRYWKWGKINLWLRFHELAALFGTTVILLHTGLRLHNLTGWLAVFLLLILSVSGIVGRYLHMEISRELVRRKKAGEAAGVIDRLGWWRDRFRSWRKFHIPLTKAFFLILVVHLIATAFYGGWKM